MKANDPVNPVILYETAGDMGVCDSHGGLTKREYFAVLAMQNLQNVLLRKSGMDILKVLSELHQKKEGPELIALLACKQADALIAALNEGKDVPA